MAPLARQVVTIIGSISGVSPTAVEIPNKKASSQSCLVRPLIKNTNGTMTIMKRIKTQLTELTPLVKLVVTFSLATAPAIEPNIVSEPTSITSPSPLPEMTLLPISAMFS